MAYLPLNNDEKDQEDHGQHQRNGIVLRPRAIGSGWPKIGALLRQPQADIGKRPAEQCSSDPVDAMS